MSLEGRIIEFLDAEQLRVAYVRKQERDRLLLVDPRGRNLSVNSDRVVIVHRPASEGDFPAAARQISEKIAVRQSEVDVELLWQSLSGKQRELEPVELAEMFFAEGSPENASAVFRALCEDTLFFKRKGSQFLPKTEEQVSAERTRRQRERERGEARDRIAGVITQLVRKKEVEITPEVVPILDRIQNWLKYKTGDEMGTILEEVAGASKARDAAYDILMRSGRIDPSLDRFLVMSGIDGHFPKPVLDTAQQLAPFVPGPARMDYQDVPAFSIEVRFDEQGHRLGYRIALTTIQVGKRFSYDEADKALDAGDVALRTLHDIARQLQDARARRGAITFRRPELKIRVHGQEIEIKKIDPNSPSRFIVSEMMILANGLAADFASMNSIPVIYRTQEPREALAVEDAPAVEALAFERLRKTFKRSRLSLTPGLHSGLGLGAYTQASSPIRRYADLVTQRQFTAMLSGDPIPHGREELLKILTTAEAAEQEIRAIEDRSTTYWLLEYLSRHKKDEPLAAIVLDTKGNVELEDYYLRAKVPAVNTLEAGETVQVLIESIDPARGEVRFRRMGT